jgi:basic amino acid/polyamine antiporter, APA family
MIGAGIFAALAPAAEAAGSGILVALVAAGVVAYCNATSSAQLAALYPESGGTYVYGSKQLGELWGFLAGWGFVVGKVASCAAIALTFGNYVEPDLARPLAIGAVITLTTVNYFGIEKTSLLTRLLVTVVLLALVAVVIAALSGGEADGSRLTPLAGDGGLRGILEAAGLLFFAFAGYARIATLGEEVRDPQRSIPRAILIALAITLAIYATVATAVLAVLGADQLADAEAPLISAVQAGDLDWLTPVVRIGAVMGSLGVLLSLLVGVSRTTFAMASSRHLPAWLAAVHPRHNIPHHAEIAVGLVVVVLVSALDLRNAIGFSSFAVLIYYTITNASAFTLSEADRRSPRGLTVLGMAGCITLAFSLPAGSVLAGSALMAAGVLLFTLFFRSSSRS